MGSLDIKDFDDRQILQVRWSYQRYNAAGFNGTKPGWFMLVLLVI